MLHRLPSRTRPLVAFALSALLAAALAATALASGRSVLPDPRLADAPLSAPGEWFDSQRLVTEDLSPTAYAEAIDQAVALGERTREVDPALAGTQWTLQGPRNIGGRVVGLAIDPDDPTVLYAAAASGGVWKSTDGGSTFEPAWPANVTQAMGDITNDSLGTLYAGTGEANPGGGSVVYGGNGVYKSTDGGRTWEHVGLARTGAIGRIAVDPQDDRRIFVAAAGNLFRPGQQRGLYVSEDAGASWELAFEPPNGTTGAIDVSIDPQNPDNILVAMWDHYRTPDARVYGGPGSGVWRSTDGGDSWARASEITLPDPNETGRIGVAFAPSDPDRAYAVIANKLDGTHGAFFRSDDGGATWDELPVDANLRATNSSYGGWFSRIFVDPDDADRLFVAGMELTESIDGGDSFLNQTSYLVGVATGAHQVAVHADQHAMVWHPAVPGLVFLGNDGGVYRSAADGRAGTWLAADVQGWTQHYSVDVAEQAPEYTVTGLQDNLCMQSADADGVVSDFAWTKFGFCGDGLETVVDPANPARGFACSQYGACGRTLAGAPRDLVGGTFPRGDRQGWFADIEYDPSNPAIVWTHTNYLWRSTNSGDGWTRYSEDLSTDPEQLDPNPGYKLRGVATTIAPVGDGTSAWVGTDEGLLWLVDENGQTLVEDEDLPGARTRGDGTIEPGLWITKVLVDQATGDVYVAYSGFRNDDEDAQVFRSTDDGATWEDISGDLPSAPVNSLEMAGDALVAATDVGVFLTRDAGEDWLRVGGNLPTVPVMDLRYHAPTNQLIAATFGHGIQRLVLPGAPAAAADAATGAVATASGAASAVGVPVTELVGAR